MDPLDGILLWGEKPVHSESDSLSMQHNLRRGSFPHGSSWRAALRDNAGLLLMPIPDSLSLAPLCNVCKSGSVPVTLHVGAGLSLHQTQLWRDQGEQLALPE